MIRSVVKPVLQEEYEGLGARSSIGDGGPAFPMQDSQAIHAYAAAAVEGVIDPTERDRLYTVARAQAIGGMTLLDYFAGLALQGMLTTSGHPALLGLEGGEAETAKAAYDIAEAMLVERNKRRGGGQ